MTENKVHMWRWPVAIATATTCGLVLALFDDGWFDAAAWFGLGLPLLVIVFHWRRSASAPNNPL